MRSLNPTDRAAFEAELTRLNLRQMQWIAIAGNLFLWGVFVFLAIRPVPGAAAANVLNGLLCLNGLGTLACLWGLRRRASGRVWTRLLVLENAAALLGLLNGYYFAMVPAYGSTSLYVIGVLVTATAYRLPPRTLWTLLLLNHAVFLAVLFATPHDPNLRLTAPIDFSGVVMLAGVIGTLLYRAFEENFLKERVIRERNLELERLRRIDRDESAAARLAEEKTRLEMLRYQLNPHFLYNALNSIRALVFTKPPAAGEMVSQLADLCRVTLTRNEDLAPVSEEFAMLRLYLDMEKTRWREKLSVSVACEPEAAAQLIPPFLLLPLVENALKHGRQSTPGVLQLELDARIDEPNALVLEVANTGEWINPGEGSAPSTGIGLENLRQRLRRYYRESHEMRTSTDGGWVRVWLRLPRLNPPADPPPVAGLNGIPS